LASCSSAASSTAIALAAITTTTDVENSATVGAATLTHSKKTIQVVRLSNRTVHCDHHTASSDDRPIIAPSAQMISSCPAPANVQKTTFSDDRQQAAGADPEMTAKALLSWMDPDDYGFFSEFRSKCFIFKCLCHINVSKTVSRFFGAQS